MFSISVCVLGVTDYCSHNHLPRDSCPVSCERVKRSLLCRHIKMMIFNSFSQINVISPAVVVNVNFVSLLLIKYYR